MASPSIDPKPQPPLALCTFVHDRRLDPAGSEEPVHRVARSLHAFGLELSPDGLSMHNLGTSVVLTALVRPASDECESERIIDAGYLRKLLLGLSEQPTIELAGDGVVCLPAFPELVSLVGADCLASPARGGLTPVTLRVQCDAAFAFDSELHRVMDVIMFRLIAYSSRIVETGEQSRREYHFRFWTGGASSEEWLRPKLAAIPGVLEQEYRVTPQTELSDEWF